MSRHCFCGYSTTLSRQNFFYDPYRWLNSLLQHRNLCCNKIFLAYLSSLLFSVVTEFYYFAAFIVATENFFVATEILPSVLHYVTT